MKTLLIVLVTVASNFAFASGYKCDGNGYSAKLFNQTQPSLGTKNPAVLIVASDTEGTLLKLNAPDIVKTITNDTVGYSGLGHLTLTGEFASVSLEVEKASSDGDTNGFHDAKLTLVADGAKTEVVVICSEYLKGNGK